MIREFRDYFLGSVALALIAACLWLIGGFDNDHEIW